MAGRNLADRLDRAHGLLERTLEYVSDAVDLEHDADARDLRREIKAVLRPRRRRTSSTSTHPE